MSIFSIALCILKRQWRQTLWKKIFLARYCKCMNVNRLHASVLTPSYELLKKDFSRRINRIDPNAEMRRLPQTSSWWLAMIVKDGKISLPIFPKGFADLPSQQKMEKDRFFRIASSDKSPLPLLQWCALGRRANLINWIRFSKVYPANSKKPTGEWTDFGLQDYYVLFYPTCLTLRITIKDYSTHLQVSDTGWSMGMNEMKIILSKSRECIEPL